MNIAEIREQLTVIERNEKFVAVRNRRIAFIVGVYEQFNEYALEHTNGDVATACSLAQTLTLSYFMPEEA